MTEEKKKVSIALDCMGGDYAPTEIVKGAITAARTWNIKIFLVGKKSPIEEELQKYDISALDLEVVQADSIIEMGESPAKAVLKKKDSSIVVAVGLVEEGKAQAFVSAGNTGACMAASLIRLGRLTGIERPAIAALLPTLNRKPAILIDAGANAECDTKMLIQFAQMGSIFSSKVVGVENPRVGILNIGGEASKGNTLMLGAYKALKDNPGGINFVGNVEGREVFLGEVDVLVCDGFSGNVTLKVAEGVAKMLMQILRSELSHDFRNQLGAFLAKPAFKRVKKRLDYEEYGGSLLLGVNGITVIAHGGSNDSAIKNAIRVGMESVEKDVTSKIIGMCEMSAV
ncbi:MAG: phosphate acyltransferase PlsX [Cyanobacteriota bacterium]